MLFYEVSEAGYERDIPYAFVIASRVVCVGKFVRMLVERMHNYKTPGPSQKTNVANRQRILDSLSSGEAVDIWDLFGCDPLNFRGIKVSLAAGLEDTLIGLIKPP